MATNWIGFDVDHTLVSYNVNNLIRDQFQHVVDKARSSIFPTLKPPTAAWLKNASSKLAHRGVIIDSINGDFIIKTPRTKSKCDNSIVVFHGIEPLRNHTAVQNSSQVVMTLNEVAVAPIYAYLITQLDLQKICFPSDTTHQYEQLFHLTKKWMASYFSNVFENTLRDKPHRLLKQASGLLKCLKDLRRDSKLFILTNGEWEHCNRVLSYVLKDAEWYKEFEGIWTEADKSQFFNNTSRKVLENRNKFPANVYSRGNIKDLVLQLGSEPVTFIGDHPLQDIKLPQECCCINPPWKFVAVAPELEEKISFFQKKDKSYLDSELAQDTRRYTRHWYCNALAAITAINNGDIMHDE